MKVWMLGAVVLLGALALARGNHFQTPDLCFQEVLTGECGDYLERWNFNPKSGTCHQFMYTGCKGNENNFETLTECLQTCTGSSEAKTEDDDHTKMEAADKEDQLTLNMLEDQDNMEVKTKETPKQETSEQDKMPGADKYDQLTLDQLEQQDNMETFEVVGKKEPVEVKEENTEEQRDENEEEKEDDWHTKMPGADEQDQLTLSMLEDQDNMELFEVIGKRESEISPEGKNEKQSEAQEPTEDNEHDKIPNADKYDQLTLDMLEDQDNMDVMEAVSQEGKEVPEQNEGKTEEHRDDWHDKMPGADAQDQLTLNMLEDQDNMEVFEVVGKKEKVEEQHDKVESPKEEEDGHDKMPGADDQDQMTLNMLEDQDNMEVFEVVGKKEKAEDKQNEDNVEAADEEHDKMPGADAQDQLTLNMLEDQDNMEVFEVVGRKEKEDTEQTENPEQTEDAEQDKMPGADAQDQLTLNMLEDQDNMEVFEVVGRKEKENAEEAETSEQLQDDEHDKMPGADAQDQLTLNMLQDQDNMEVFEVVGRKEKENTEQTETPEQTEDAEHDNMPGADAQDQLTLNMLEDQDNMEVFEVVGRKKQENKEETPEQTQDDEHDKMPGADAQDQLTLNMLEDQENMEVFEVVGRKEKENTEQTETPEQTEDDEQNKMPGADAQDQLTLNMLEDQDNMEVFEVVGRKEKENKEETPEQTEGDEHDKMPGADAQDQLTLNMLEDQDNMEVFEVVGRKEQENKKENPEQTEDDEHNKMPGADAQDQLTLNMLEDQDNMEVFEVVGRKEQIEQQQQNVKNAEEKDDEHDKMPGADAQDQLTLNMLEDQDNMDVFEVVGRKEPVEEKSEQKDQNKDDWHDKIQGADEQDQLTLNMLEDQDNMEIFEVVGAKDKFPDESKQLKVKKYEEGDFDEEKDIEQLHADKDDEAVLRQLYSQPEFEPQHIHHLPNGGIYSHNFRREEEIDETDETTVVGMRPENEEQVMKIVKTIDNDDDFSDLNTFTSMIDDDKDRSDLQQLFNQENMDIETLEPEDHGVKMSPPDFNKVRDPGRFEPEHLKDQETLVNLMNTGFRVTKPIAKSKEDDRFSFYETEEEPEQPDEEDLGLPESWKKPPCCLHPKETGLCKANMMMWYYDSKVGTCLPFTYGGCGGNRNKFETIGACLLKCGGIVKAGQPGHPNRVPEPRMNNRIPHGKFGFDRRIFAPGPFSPDIEPTTTPPVDEPEHKPIHSIFPNIISRWPVLRMIFNRKPAPKPVFEPESDEESSEEIEVMPPRRFGGRREFRNKPRFEGRRRDDDDRRNFGRKKGMKNFFMTTRQYRVHAPRMEKKMIHAPMTRDNRYQHHSTPNNKINFLQVFVNKRPQSQDFYREGRPSPFPRPSPYRPAPRPFFRPPFYRPFMSPPRTHIFLKFDANRYPGDMETTTPFERHDHEDVEYVTMPTSDIGERVGEPNYACLLHVEKGMCKALMSKWFFDQESGNCKQFFYGGCGGNANRFDSIEECVATCRTTSPVPQTSTEYPQDVTVITEQVYQQHGEQESTTQPMVSETQEEEKVEEVVEQKVEETPEVIEETKEEAVPVENFKTDDVEEQNEIHQSASVFSLPMNTHTNYLIILIVMSVVGVCVIILVALAIAFVCRRKEAPKDKVVEAYATPAIYDSHHFPNLLYYKAPPGTPPPPCSDIPSVHSLESENTKV